MILYLLVFLSGLSALIYQILWMRQLGLLFGNTSHAAGATLAAFFAGLAIGSWFWGRKVTRSHQPLRIYAALEFGIAITALLYFVIIKGYHAVYPELYQNVHSEAWLLLIKFMLALALVFPPAFCMGGTIPVIGQHAIRGPKRFGQTSALLYGINTLGATLGALLAGFFMPVWFGFRMTCWIAIAITTGVALLALVVSRWSPPDGSSQAGPDTSHDAATTQEPDTQAGMSRAALTTVCFASGFGVLALEVLWTRMFSLVLENSVYTYSAILVVVLSFLAAGSLVSSLLARTRWPAASVMPVLLVLGGIAVALTPTVFMQVTDSFRFLAVKATWSDFVWMVFRKCLLAIGPPVLLLGAVFPYLMKAEERHAAMPGRSLGRLATINTIGAIIGSLLCAFLLLEHLGLWRSMQVIGILYFLMAFWLSPLRTRLGLCIKGIGAAGVVLLLTSLDPSHLPATGTLESRTQEVTLKTWEGSDCTVSVVRNQDDLSIKINSDYGLGSTSSRVRQACQAEIPLMLKPDAENVFFLGMGTGITAGAALSKERFPRVKRVVTCELSPHVITAAKEFMTNVGGSDLTNGLFTDPRSSVLAEDGRHYLMATREKFDVIASDLFVPYRSCAGSLYSLEHFESVKQRLTADGIFVQWLPVYQLTEFDFHVIGRTMLETFDHVSLWRCDFAPFDEVVAFVGHMNGSPLPACEIDDSAVKRAFLESRGRQDIYETLNRQTALMYYCGNVTASKHIFDAYPINSDDKPVIEYMAPKHYRNQGQEQTPWFVGPYILKFIKDLQAACPPDKDPLLANRQPANRRLPLAASAFHEANLWARFGNEAEAQRSWELFVREWMGN